MNTTDDFFEPSSIECSGAELSDVIASLEKRGAKIVAMDAVSISGWKLTLAWPVDDCPK